MAARHDIPAVLTDLNVNGLAVARTLGRHGVPVLAIHPNRDDPETRSRFVDDLWTCTPGDNHLVELLLQKGKTFARPPVLLAITDLAVQAVARHLEALRRHYVVPMPAPELVLELIDKVGFDARARALGLPLPGTWRVDRPEQLPAAELLIPFPCILKPQAKTAAYTAAGGKKAYVIDDLDSLRSTYASFCDVEPRVVIQQFIPGGDDQVYFCLQACAADGSPILPFAGRKLRQWRPYCGGTSACEPVDAPVIVEQTSRFFAQVGMVGPCSMEFKRDPRDGTFYLIEPTVCRPDWQSGLADANGVPVVYGAYCAALGLPLPAPRRRRLRRRWVVFGDDRRSAAHYIRRRELGRLAWLWSIHPPIRGAFFALDDPGPYLAILGATARRGLRKLGRLLGRGATPDTLA